MCLSVLSSGSSQASSGINNQELHKKEDPGPLQVPAADARPFPFVRHILVSYFIRAGSLPLKPWLKQGSLQLPCPGKQIRGVCAYRRILQCLVVFWFFLEDVLRTQNNRNTEQRPAARVIVLRPPCVLGPVTAPGTQPGTQQKWNKYSLLGGGGSQNQVH